jgi:hypothetical protein
VCFALALCASGGAWCQSKGPDDIWNPSVTTLTQLPKYCWAQYKPEFKQTGIKSPVELCGVWMNHLCPGLVYMSSARKAIYPKNTRLDLAKKALDQFNYTIKGMPTSCPIAEDVYTAKVQAETLIKLLK